MYVLAGEVETMVRRRSLLASVVLSSCCVYGGTATATTEPVAPAVYPLTGLPVDDESTVGRPALVIPIDNWGPQGPHAGLNEADVVFELIAEGRATRMLAVFNSRDADPVGPIRSGRTQDVMLFGALSDPVFAHSGGNEFVVRALLETDWTVLDQGDEGFFRSDQFGNGAPHNLYANTSELFPQAGGSGPVVPQFSYLPPDDMIAGDEVGTIDVRVGNNPVRWVWDASAGEYLRWQGGAVHETNTGQVAATTVIVVVVPYGESPAAFGSPEAQTVGTGKAVVYVNGRRVEGTWTRESTTSTFSIEAAGEPILVPPGRTWILVADAEDHEITES
jgi:hypothetical protein